MSQEAKGPISKGNVLCLRIRYNIFLRHNIAFTYYIFLFFSFYFYCLELVNPMTNGTKCIDLLLCTFKTGHLLLIMMVTDYIKWVVGSRDGVG